jgi:hypothetical protein
MSPARTADGREVFGLSLLEFRRSLLKQWVLTLLVRLPYSVDCLELCVGRRRVECPLISITKRAISFRYPFAFISLSITLRSARLIRV